MGVTASAMVRMAYVGGLATLGLCLMWMGATQAHHGRSSFPAAALQYEMILPSAPPAPSLPAAPAIVIATGNAIAAVKPAHATPADINRTIIHYKGAIHGSLFESAMAQGVPIAMLSEMIHAFSYDVDFQRDIQPDDQFDVMIERSNDKKPVSKMLFASLTLSGEVLQLYRYADSQGMTDYYTPSGESARKALLKTPVDGAKITSGFGMRFHPILHFTTQHKGIDFAVMTGTPVMAAGAGVIDYAGTNGSYGLYVRIKHDQSHETAYAHLSRLAPGMRPGKSVAQGQTIGFSGATGRATGPHLHYEVLVNESQVNPMSVKFQAGRKLAGKELARFHSAEKQASAWLAQTPATTRTASRGN